MAVLAAVTEAQGQCYWKYHPRVRVPTNLFKTGEPHPQQFGYHCGYPSGQLLFSIAKRFFFAYFPAICCHSAPADFPQTCTLQESIPSIIEANFSEPALIQCSATCQTEMSCNHTLRLYVPNGAVVIDLAGELSTSRTLFSHETDTAIQWESHNVTCIAIAEFCILPKSYNLHGSLSMCGVVVSIIRRKWPPYTSLRRHLS